MNLLGRATSLSLAVLGLSACNGAMMSDTSTDSGLDVVIYFDAPLMDGADGDAAAPLVWTCPPEWVHATVGGCGPAVLLCPSGGAMPGECDRIDFMHPHAVSSEADGGTSGTSFFRLADGGIGGGWTGAQITSTGGIGCPIGWATRPDGSCDPALPTSCPAGSAALPGASCTATAATDCPTTRWADPGPGSMGAMIVYVAAGASSTSADGSQAHPYATLAAAIHASGDGAWILVAGGTYSESVAVSGTLHVIGTCAAQVSIASPSTSPTFDVQNAGTRFELRGMTVSGMAAALNVGSTAQVHASGIRVDQAGGVGINARDSGTSVTLSDALVTNTRVVLMQGAGVGIQVTSGASLVASRVVNAANHDGLVITGEGSSATLSDSTLRDALPRYDANSPAGLGVTGGADVTATRMFIANDRGFGIRVDGAGSTLSITDAIVRDTNPESDAAPGLGAESSHGGSLLARRVEFSGNRGRGVDASGNDAVVTLIDCAVLGTVPYLSGLGGYGLAAGSGGTLSATRVVVANDTEAAIAAIPGIMNLADVLVASVRPSVRGLGFGVLADGTGNVQAARLAVDGAQGVGIAGTYVGMPPTGAAGSVHAQDVYVHQVMPGSAQVSRAMPAARVPPDVAYGLFVSSSATLQFDRLLIDEGQVGFLDDGVLDITIGVITEQRMAAVVNGPSAQMRLVLDGVQLIGNDDDTVQNNTTLPLAVFSP